MRSPAVRFPFIISFHQKNHRGGTRDTAFLSSLQNLGKELKSLNLGNKENFSLILKKMIFLESTLDELLEVESSEKDESLSRPFVELEQQKIEKFFIGMIPILDILDSACSSAAESEEPELTRGLEILRRKFVQHLSSWEFTKSADEGIKFDPLFHEAVGTNLSSREPGLITDIIEHGWILNGKVLRFAKVIVAK